MKPKNVEGFQLSEKRRCMCEPSKICKKSKIFLNTKMELKLPWIVIRISPDDIIVVKMREN